MLSIAVVLGPILQLVSSCIHPTYCYMSLLTENQHDAVNMLQGMGTA